MRMILLNIKIGETEADYIQSEIVDTNNESTESES